MAWRTIGLAAREAIVLGLHRRAILFQRFPDEKDRKLAARVFWTIYVLDRRWSFGTGLCFALADRDIDGDLPLLVSATIKTTLPSTQLYTDTPKPGRRFCLSPLHGGLRPPLLGDVGRTHAPGLARHSL